MSETEFCALCSHSKQDHEEIAPGEEICYGCDGWEDGGACSCAKFVNRNAKPSA